MNTNLAVVDAPGSNHTRDILSAALDYASHGWKVFPLGPGTKKPNMSGAFYNGTSDENQIRQLFTEHPNANIGIRTGAESGLVVLDVDQKNGHEGFVALEELTGGFVPETLTVTTPSGGQHLYFAYTGKEIRNSASNIGDGLDVRGDGGYIVAPPSVVDGRTYSWDNYGADLADAPEWLWPKPVQSEKTGKGVRQGRRNDYIFRLASKLRGQGVPYEEAQEEVLRAASECDPPLPDEEALKCLEGVYGRYPAGEPLPPEIVELNEKHAAVMLGGKFCVMNFEYDPIRKVKSGVTYSTPANFKERYAHRRLGGVGLGVAWFSHHARRQYEGIVFAPGKDVSGYYNLWQGFAVEPKEGDCSLFLDHIRDNICNGKEEHYEYILAFMANIVQEPWDLPGVALVLRGKQGTGKGAFVTEFGELFGPHFKQLSHSKQLTGHFNSHLGDALVVFADEAFWGGHKDQEGVLKALITEERLMVEPKGLNAFEVKNHRS